MKIFLELDQKTGNLYEFSKDAKEGFEKHVSTTGKESLRRVQKDGLIGKLKYINKKEEDFGKGKFEVAVIVVEDENKDLVYMKLPILDVRGSLNEYFQNLVTFLPNMKVGEAYRIFPYSMDTTYTAKNGEVKPTTNKGFAVSTYDMDAGVKVDKVERALKFGKEGDIPAVVWREEEDLGKVKNVKDDKAQRNYLYNAFVKVLTPFEANSTATPTAQEPKQTPSPAPASKSDYNGDASFNEEEHDDLPF